MYGKSKLKDGCADKGVHAFIDLQNAVTEAQKNQRAGINDQKKQRKMLELEVFNGVHGLVCQCGYGSGKS